MNEIKYIDFLVLKIRCRNLFELANSGFVGNDNYGGRATIRHVSENRYAYAFEVNIHVEITCNSISD